MNIQNQLDDLQKVQEELKIESQMMAVAVAKLQIENQELKNEANELMIKNDQQQMQIEELTSKYQSMLENSSFRFLILYANHARR